MRDILITAIVVLLVLRMLRKPETGPYLWAWISIMNPHKLAYGFAASAPFALVTAGLTLTTFLFSKQARKPFPVSSLTVVYILLILWMTVSSLFSINPTDAVWERWFFVMKIHLMMLITLMMLRGRKQIETLMWVVMGSLAVYGIKGGIWTIASGGASRVWGPPGGMTEDNNAMAVALILVLPLMHYLRNTLVNRWLRLGMLGAMLLVGVAILGSQSRGALLGLLAMAFFLGAKGKKPIRFTIVLTALLVAGISFMPENWTKRMDTIQGYKADSSAMSRLYTWQTLWNVGLDRPLVGAGFASDNLALFDRYAPRDPEYNVQRGTVWVAHSIYFQALGEHGFVGLILYVSIWVLLWMAASRATKKAERIPDLAEWAPMLLRMCQVSMVGFCVGGAFLSLMHLDIPFYLLTFVLLTRCAIEDRYKALSAEQTTVKGLAAAPNLQLEPSRI
jgi:probable O-glycosylation ligase (exosortase A-associated)